MYALTPREPAAASAPSSSAPAPIEAVGENLMDQFLSFTCGISRFSTVREIERAKRDLAEREGRIQRLQDAVR